MPLIGRCICIEIIEDDDDYYITHQQQQRMQESLKYKVLNFKLEQKIKEKRKKSSNFNSN